MRRAAACYRFHAPGRNADPHPMMERPLAESTVRSRREMSPSDVLLLLTITGIRLTFYADFDLHA